MNKLKLTYLILTSLTTTALVAVAAYLLGIQYPDVLFTAQDRNVFTTDPLFFHDQVSRPFGLFQYLGAWFTQFFYHPAIGAAILIDLWLVIAFVAVKAFSLRGIWCSLAIIPPACLLASEISIGYWIYCLPIPGYWFSHTLGLSSLMLLLWAAKVTPRRYRFAWYAVVGFCLFPVFGWISYLFSISLAIMQFAKGEERISFPSWVDSAGITLTAVAPLIFGALLYEDIPTNNVYSAGFPFFVSASDETPHLSHKFYILIAATLFMAFGRLLPRLRKIPACAAQITVGIASAWLVCASAFDNENYLSEMKMTQAAMNDDWQGIISVAEKSHAPSRTMVVLKNIALLNTGQLGERSFALGNDGVEIYNPDSLNLSIMHIAAPVAYYNHALVNYAIRWSMELAIPYGFSPFYLRMLARSANTTGETALERRYTARLNSMLFYSDWKPAKAPESVSSMLPLMHDAVDNDENNCERYIMKKFYKDHTIKNPYYIQLNLNYSLILRNVDNFMVALYDYLTAHPDATLPRHYQEAYYFFKSQSGMTFPYEVKISPEIAQRFSSFMQDGNHYADIGMTEQGVREAMRDNWSDTYWWFNAFGRNSY